MSSARIYARNLAANWIAHAANLVVLFFLSPFVVHTLGPVEYGIWSLLQVLTGYMGVLDLGIRASTGRYIILYLGKKDHEKVDQTIRTGLGIYTAVGCFIIAIAFGLGWVFPKVFSSVPQNYHRLVKILLLIMSINVLFSALRAVFSSILTAHDRFDLARGLDLGMLAIRTVATIWALRGGYGILGLAIVVVACNVIGLGGNWIIARRVYRRLKIWPLKIFRQRLPELFGYGSAAFITSIASRIIGQTDLIVVGILISTSDVTVYSVGAMLIYYSSTFLGQINTTFFPPVQRAVAQGKMGEARWFFFRQVRLALIFGIPLNVGFILFGKTFIRLWMLDPKFPESAVGQAALVMAILAGSKLLTHFTAAAYQLLNAMGRVRFTAIMSVMQAVLNLGLSIFFVTVLDWGIAGVAGGTLAARFLVSTFFAPWYTFRKAQINIRRFIIDIVGRAVISMAMFAGASILIQRLIPDSSWLWFAVQVALSLVFYAPIALIVLVPKNDRERLFMKLKWLFRQERTGSSEQEIV